MNKIPVAFPIQVFGKAEKISDTITKKRLRIFYRGLNRNGSYISDEFAERLIETLPYTPIKGIYDDEEEDFGGHSRDRSQGKIYGVVPENPNFEWETHLDEDNVEREYATADVYLFSALFEEELEEIEGKAQSMELYPPSIKGEWVEINGTSFYRFSDAAFLGLQILGENVEPCFEGSSFYSLDTKEAQNFYTYIMELFSFALSQGTKVEDSIEEEKDMKENEYDPIFKLSEREKENKLFKALNPKEMKYWIIDVYSDFIVVVSLDEEGLYKVSYTKDEEEGTVSLGEEFTPVFVEYVTEEERKSLDEMKGDEEKSLYEMFVESKEKISELEVDLSDKDEEIFTIKTEKENSDNQVQELTQKVEELSEYQAGIELAEKEAIIDRYSERLDEAILEKYKEEIAEHSAEELDKELAYELVKTDSTLFEKKEDKKYYKKDEKTGGVNTILDQYSHEKDITEV